VIQSKVNSFVNNVGVKLFFIAHIVMYAIGDAANKTFFYVFILFFHETKGIQASKLKIKCQKQASIIDKEKRRNIKNINKMRALFMINARAAQNYIESH
jgi:hypothetical protein